MLNAALKKLLLLVRKLPKPTILRRAQESFARPGKITPRNRLNLLCVNSRTWFTSSATQRLILTPEIWPASLSTTKQLIWSTKEIILASRRHPFLCANGSARWQTRRLQSSSTSWPTTRKTSRTYSVLNLQPSWLRQCATGLRSNSTEECFHLVIETTLLYQINIIYTL